MTNQLKIPQAGADPLASDVGQFAKLLQGLIDVGVLQLAAPQSTPAAPTVAQGSTAGNLNGAYDWVVVLVTGWKQDDNTYYVSGFAPSAASSSVTITNNVADLSNIGTGTDPVIGRAIYRTAAGGAAGTEKYAGIIWDNTTTTFTDNVADANLGTGMPAVNGVAIPANVPTANTTGTNINGFTTTGPITLTNGIPMQSTYNPNDQIGFGIRNDNEIGVYSDANGASLISGEAIWLKLNNYYDGTSDKFINSNLVARQLSYNPSSQELSVRFSTNTPAKDSPITWSPFYPVYNAYNLTDQTIALINTQSPDTSGTANQYAEFASAIAVNQGDYVSSVISLMEQDGASNPLNVGFLFLQMRQNAAMGSNPYVYMKLLSLSGMSAANITAVVVNVSPSQSVVYFYYKIPSTYTILNVKSLQTGTNMSSSNLDISASGGGGLVTSLPAGTQIACN